MDESNRSSLDPLIRRGCLGACAIGALFPTLALIGWWLREPGLYSIASGDQLMTPLSAIGCLLLLLSLSLWLLMPGGRARALCVGVSAGIATAIGLGAAIEILGNIDLGIDQALWPGALDALASAHPGRPSAQTAFGLILVGLALLISLAGGRLHLVIAAICAAAATALAAVGLIGRAFDLPNLFSSASLGAGGLSVQTGSSLLATGGAVAIATGLPIVMELRSRSAGARRVLAVMVPVGFGLPVLVALGTTAAFELAPRTRVLGPLVVGAAVGVLLGVGLWLARSLARAELSTDTLMRSLPSGVLVTVDDRVAYANLTAAEMLPANGHGTLDGNRLADVLAPGLANEIELAKSKAGPVTVETEAPDGDRVLEVANLAATWAGRPASLYVLHDTTALWRAQSELQDAHDRLHADYRSQDERVQLYAAMVESSDEAILTKTLDGVITGWNPAAQRLYGYPPEEAIGQHIELIVPPDRREELHSILEHVKHGEPVHSLETVRTSRDGRRIDISLTISPVRSQAGELIGASALSSDISERKETEHLAEQLRHSQKMDAMGRLASGIAHDFNNLLSVIIGSAQLGLTQLPPDDETHELMGAIDSSAAKAAELTRHLLTFSRGSVVSLKRVELNAIVEGIKPMLSTLTGDTIKVSLEMEPTVGAIEADPTQLHQVLVNLVVNGRDAMPDGGRLTIATESIDLGEGEIDGGSDLEPGPHLLLSVTDTGVGMDPATAERVFEPFFTTKGPEKGTGLGLSTSYGLVKQAHGHMTVRSVPGEGTTFTVILPAVASRPPSQPEQESPTGEQRLVAGRTILVVDDRPSVGAVAKRNLEAVGYRVLAARSGKEALETLEGPGVAVDVLLTDVSMPDMDGIELAETVAAAFPRVNIILSSGTEMDPPARDSSALTARTSFLQKPWSREELLEAIASALDGT